MRREDLTRIRVLHLGQCLGVILLLVRFLIQNEREGESAFAPNGS